MPRDATYQKERSARQLRRILAALQTGQKTAYDLSDELHLSRYRVQVYLNELMDEPRRVRVADYQQTGSRPRAVYALGTEPSLTPDQFMENRILMALLEKPMTVQELADKLGSSKMDVGTVLNRLNGKRRKVYVCGYQPGGGKMQSRLFDLGNLPNEQHPIKERKRTRKGREERDQMVVDALALPGTTAQLARRLDIGVRAASNYAKRLHGANPKRLCIIGWAAPPNNKGGWAAIYRAGDQADVEFVPLREQRQLAAEKAEQAIQAAKENREKERKAGIPAWAAALIF